MKTQLRTCANNHRYYKSSDCPSCAICAADKKPLFREATAASQKAVIFTLNTYSITTKYTKRKYEQALYLGQRPFW